MYMKGIRFSELKESDNYQQYLALLQQLTSLHPEEISQEQFQKHLQMINSNPYHKIIIAKDADGNIVGTVTLLIEPKFIHDLSYVAHIEDVVVSTDYRKQGIGKLLVEKAIGMSKEFHCYKVILDCAETCVGFYQSCGFKVKERQMALYF